MTAAALSEWNVDAVPTVSSPARGSTRLDASHQLYISGRPGHTVVPFAQPSLRGTGLKKKRKGRQPVKKASDVTGDDDAST